MKTLGVYLPLWLATAVVAFGVSGCGKSVTDRGASATYSSDIIVTGGSSSSSGGGGSSSGGPGCDTQVTCYKDEYHEPDAPPPGPRKVDVLFMVSTAASFDAYRIAVGAAVKDWVKSLPQGTDYRFAVMLAHAEDEWAGTLYPGCGGPKVLRSDEMPLEKIGEYLDSRIVINSGENASDGGEAFTISLQKSLQGENVKRIQREGFYRPDAALEIVTMTARNDICWTALDYPGGTKPTSDPFYSIEQTERAQLCQRYSAADAVFAVDQFKGSMPVGGASFAFTPSSTVPSGTSGVIGYTEMSFMSQLGGFMIPLDQSSKYVVDLAPLAQPTFPTANPLQDSFILRTTSTLLDPTTLTVTVDGQTAPFTLDSTTMDLTLGSSFTGLNPGSIVDINYCTIPQMAP